MLYLGLSRITFLSFHRGTKGDRKHPTGGSRDQACDVLTEGRRRELSSRNVAHVLARTRRVVLVDGDPPGKRIVVVSGRNPGARAGRRADREGETRRRLVSVTDRLSILPTFGLNGTLKAYAEGRSTMSRSSSRSYPGTFRRSALTWRFSTSRPASRASRSASFSRWMKYLTGDPGKLLDGWPLDPHDGAGQGQQHYRRHVLHRRLVLNNLNRSFSRHLEVLEALQGKDYELFVVPRIPRLLTLSFTITAFSTLPRIRGPFRR